MRGLGFQRQSKSIKKFILPSLISCIFVIISQFALAMIPSFFPSFSLLAKLPLSAFLLLFIAVLGRSCRRLLRVCASAPAFVFFNILFIWGFHIAVVGKAVPSLTSIAFNAECALLMVGLYSILSSDPGWFADGSSSLDGLVQTANFDVKPHFQEEELSMTGVSLERPTVKTEEDSCLIKRVRYCKSCKAYIRGLDHHCPAFGNCIGQKNHVLFMVLLVGFVMTEVSYIVCSTQFIRKSQIVDKAFLETSLSSNLAISTILFSLLQVLWQVIFLIWHIYCICFNIKTEEWINWKKYPEFQLHVEHQPGQPFSETRFRNPYDKGVLHNIKELLLQNE